MKADRRNRPSAGERLVPWLKALYWALKALTEFATLTDHFMAG